MQRIDLSGKTFGRWTVQHLWGKDKHGKLLWTCRCACGVVRVIVGEGLASGSSKSCGCMRSRTRGSHGRYKSAEYRTWHKMKQRCTNPNGKFYKDYGGRGIAVCERWNDFQNFFADMGEKPSSEYTIERIDNDRGYEPGNVIWATQLKQARNKRNSRSVTYRGETHCVSEWAEILSLPKSRILYRLNAGWGIDAVFNCPRLFGKSRPKII